MLLIDYPADAPLQDVWQNATCYGCGPANQRGLHIKSYWDAATDEAYCTFIGQPYHNAGFPNVMYGGLVASLCDCHSVWAAIAHTYIQEGALRLTARHQLRDGELERDVPRPDAALAADHLARQSGRDQRAQGDHFLLRARRHHAHSRSPHHSDPHRGG